MGQQAESTQAILELARQNDEAARESAQLQMAAAKQQTELLAKIIQNQTLQSSRRSSRQVSQNQSPVRSSRSGPDRVQYLKEEPTDLAAGLNSWLLKMASKAEQSQAVYQSPSRDVCPPPLSRQLPVPPSSMAYSDGPMHRRAHIPRLDQRRQSSVYRAMYVLGNTPPRVTA